MNCDVNLRDNEGMTPLMIAADYGCPENINIFLAFGADRNIVDNNGHNALWYAAESFNDSCTEALAIDADGK